MTDEKLGEITLTGVRLAFPDLFVPTAYKEDQQKQYGATFLIPKDSPQVKIVEQAIKKVAKAKWGDNAESVLKQVRHNPQKFCFMDGDTKDNLDGYSGSMALSAKNKKRPTVVDVDATQLAESDGRPYAGCYVIAKVGLWAQQNTHGKAMRASLLGVQFQKDGDSFSAGRVASASEFADLSDGVEDDMNDLV